MNAESKLKEMGLELPTPGKPVANYVSAVSTGNLVFLSGHGPLREDGTMITGKVGADSTVEEGYEAAKRVALVLLSSLKREIGDLDKVKRVIKLLGMVNCTPDFGDQPKVINGAVFDDLTDRNLRLASELHALLRCWPAPRRRSRLDHR